MRYTFFTFFCCIALTTGMTVSITRQAGIPPGAIKANGYGGDIVLAVTTTSDGAIHSLSALSHNETPSYTSGLNAFLQEFIDKTARDKLVLGKDIDGITGATVTSAGITRAVRDHLNPSPKKKIYPVYWVPILTTIFLLILIALLPLLFKSDLLRWTALVSSFIFFGLIHQSMLSITQIINFSQLRIPPLDLNNGWIIALAAGLVPSLLIGRLYCASLCPFAFVQEILARIIPEKYRLPPLSSAIDPKARSIKYILAITLITVSAVLGHSTIADIEPFITLFTRKGAALAWIFLWFTLVLSLFYFRFWCVYLCPAGALTGLIARFSAFRLTPSTKCGSCDHCANICPTKAISRASTGELQVDPAECILCGQCIKGCEKNSFNPNFAVRCN